MPQFELDQQEERNLLCLFCCDCSCLNRIQTVVPAINKVVSSSNLSFSVFNVKEVNRLEKYINASLSGKYLYYSVRMSLLVLLMEKASEDFGDSLLKVIEKLAGKESDVRLTFENLTLEMGMVKTKLNGSIVLDIVFATDKKK